MGQAILDEGVDHERRDHLLIAWMIADEFVKRIPPESHQFQVVPAQLKFLADTDQAFRYHFVDDAVFAGDGLGHPRRLFGVALRP